MTDIALPIKMSRQDFRERNPSLPLTDAQWDALTRGANIETDNAPDAVIPGWWVLAIEPPDPREDGNPGNWVLLSGYEDVYGKMFDDPNDEDTHVSAVWMDHKGRFRLGPGENLEE